MCLEVRVPHGELLDVVTYHLVCARLLTACFPESGVWLEASPLTNVRLKMVNEILGLFNFYIIIEHRILNSVLLLSSKNIASINSRSS